MDTAANEAKLRQDVLGQTLSGPAQERLASDRLKQDRRLISDQVGGGLTALRQPGWTGMGGANPPEKNEADDYDNVSLGAGDKGPTSPAQRQRSGLGAKAAEEKKGGLSSFTRSGTSRILRWAWYTLIPSFGLTLLLIDLHGLMRLIVGDKLFCKFGDEWIPAKVETIAGEAGEGAKKIAGILELIAVVALNLCAIILVLGALGVIVPVIGLLHAPFKALLGVLAAMWDKIWATK